MDYTCERGAKRNFEPWRASKLAEETEEERLDRLEREEAEHDAMAELEQKALDAKTEMAVADALDEIRTRNARNETGVAATVAATVTDARDVQREKEEKEDEEAAKRAFMKSQDGVAMAEELIEDIAEEEVVTNNQDRPKTFANSSSSHVLPSGLERPIAPPISFKKVAKKKKDFSAALGIKKKPALV